MITAIILAAGYSKRFGRNKLLEPIAGKPMIRWTLEATLNSMINEVVVVLGFEAERVYEVIKDLKCRVIVNLEYDIGMSSSVKCGVRSIMSRSEAVLIIPGDYPFIEVETINNVIKKYRETHAPIIIATYNGRRGHPILIGRELFQEVLEINEESMGLKAVIRRHENEIVYADAKGMGAITDIDSPEDLKKLMKTNLK
ncbi:MAG: nucleotidyltransferase family protein [Candidatus Methanomethylicia archaeon]